MKNKYTMSIRLFLTPMIIFIVSLAIAALILNLVVRNKIVSIYKENLTNSTLEQSTYISFNEQLKEERMGHFYTHLTAALEILIDERNLLDNDFLLHVKKATLVDDVIWSSPDGTAIYSSNPSFIGVPLSGDDPITDFINSDDTIRFDNIRKASITDRYILTGYLKDEDGYFSQAIIDVTNVNRYIENHDIKKVIERIYESNDLIIYVSVLDFNNDTEESYPFIPNHGLTFTDYFNNNKDGVFIRQTYSNVQKENILEVMVPIYYENGISDYLLIGFNINTYLSIYNQILLILTLIGLFIVFIYFIFSFLYIIKPLHILENSIRSYNVSSGKYNKPEYIPASLFQIFNHLDKLGVKIEDSNRELTILSEELADRAFYDFLTGLPNRLSLATKIDSYIKNNKEFSLLFIDINNFKIYNDSKGHSFGDKLLKEISIILKNEFSTEHFSARFGGDEFVILVNSSKVSVIKKHITNVFSKFKEPVVVKGVSCPIDLSIGVSIFPKDGENFETLIRKADLAMYDAKNDDANNFRFYHPKLDLILEKETKTLEIIRDALRDKTFYIKLQPQVDIYTNKILSYEALARIKNHDIPAGYFIEVAEKNNVINELGYVIFDEVIKTILIMRENNIELLPIFFNVSYKEFYDLEFINYMTNSLKENNISPSLIGVEITESGINENIETSNLFISSLNDAGIDVSIDDFGSGSASFNKILNHSLKQIKIDREFINLYLNDKYFKIFDSIINLAHLLDFNIVAEGIEDEEKINLLKQTKCHIVQGYYYYKPKTIDEILKLVKK